MRNWPVEVLYALYGVAFIGIRKDNFNYSVKNLTDTCDTVVVSSGSEYHILGMSKSKFPRSLPLFYGISFFLTLGKFHWMQFTNIFITNINHLLIIVFAFEFSTKFLPILLRIKPQLTVDRKFNLPTLHATMKYKT